MAFGRTAGISGMLSLFTDRGWDDPDWRVRERAASRMRNPKRLLHLVLTDVSEEVRLAAVKSLGDETLLAQVARQGVCDASRRMALRRVTDEALCLAFVKDADLSVELRLIALQALPVAEKRLLDCYTEEAPVALKVALLERIDDAPFLKSVVLAERSREARLAAIPRLRDEVLLGDLALAEPDVGLRRALLEGVKTPALVRELFTQEDDESLRVWLVARIADPVHLADLARTDHNPDVRLAAVEKLSDTSALLTVACEDSLENICLSALSRLGTDAARAAVSVGAAHQTVRFEALFAVQDTLVLESIVGQSAYPEIRWLAGRRLDRLPTHELRELAGHDRTLQRLIERESVPEIAAWLAGHIAAPAALNQLMRSSVPAVASVAALRLGEDHSAHGLRLMPVPGRPYQIGVFPVTCAQVSAVLGKTVGPSDTDDLPATGLSPEVAREFCATLSQLDGRTFRLPSFEEWQHACFASDETWLDEADVRTAGTAKKLFHTHHIPIRSSGRRPLWRAWANPWGLLDMVGNVAVWVDDPPRFLLRPAWLDGDPLAVGGDPANTDDFACAAGATWSDARVRKGRLQRLVSRAALADHAADKVGFRILCEDPGSQTRHQFRLTLLPETAPGVTRDEVLAALRAQWLEARTHGESWYRVAPLAILDTSNYDEIRRRKRMLEECGARVNITSRAVS